VQGMTEIVKPFKIISTREMPDGSRGIEFECQKKFIMSERATRQVTMKAYVHVNPGEDADAVIFNYIEGVEWV